MSDNDLVTVIDNMQKVLDRMEQQKESFWEKWAKHIAFVVTTILIGLLFAFISNLVTWGKQLEDLRKDLDVMRNAINHNFEEVDKRTEEKFHFIKLKKGDGETK